MSKLLQFLCLTALFPACLMAAVEASVVNITVTPRLPWNGKVDITYSLECTEANAQIQLAFQAHDNDKNADIVLTSLSGDGIGSPLLPGGPYKTVWDSSADYPKGHSSDLAISINVADIIVPHPITGNYLMIDLNDGTYTTSDTAPSLSGDTYRTTKLLLRRVPAGSFQMGSSSSEIGHRADETQHQVTLSKAFYIGVFEMTQQQYKLIAGSTPSQYTGSDSSTHPVENVSYDDLRGETYAWPTNGHAVDADSFLGKLRAKTGLSFDLPTEAQWEYACRAGRTTPFNTGASLTTAKKDFYADNVGRIATSLTESEKRSKTIQHKKVGSYPANDWGLYDMHGNVAEWCLDSYGEYSSSSVKDPTGATTPNGFNVHRGGHWNGLNGIFYQLTMSDFDNIDAQFCRSASRSYAAENFRKDYIGFRLCLIP